MKARLLILMAVVACVALANVEGTTPARAQTPIRAGSEVEITGTNDCLNVREAPSDKSPPLECLPDGTRGRVDRGEQDIAGRMWWHLLQHGWVAGDWLRETAPPEPDLQVSPEPHPLLQGLIAYVGGDENIWVVRADGSAPTSVTTDGTSAEQSPRNRTYYDDPSWSPDGRFLAFWREASENDGIGLYDSAAGALSILEPPPGRDFGVGFRWFDNTHLWIVDTVGGFSACDRRSFAGQSVQSLDVTNGQRETVLRASSDNVFLALEGAESPGGDFVSYEEGIYCEGPATPCAVELDTGSSQCVSGGTWSPAGWINESEMLLYDNPYGTPIEPLKQPIVFNAKNGSTRPANELDQSNFFGEPGPEGGHLRKKPSAESAGRFDTTLIHDVLVDSREVLRLPAQQAVKGPYSSITAFRQTLAPSDAAFVVPLFSFTDKSDEGLWVVLADGSQKAWRIAAGEAPAWQPKALPPVLFVHGCGGNLATWSDPGWITDTTEIGQFTSGDASGKLYRAVIPGVPAVPAYALDYHDSPGSVFDLAALIPQSIDKIREETGAEKVMLATHSMGGVLAEAYVGGLASSRGYDNDVEAAFMVAPPSKGSFLVNWLTGKAGNALACPQASELGPHSRSIVRLRSAALPTINYSIVSGTRLWIPFVGLNDGVIADGDVGLNDVGYDKRQVRGVHVDATLLPNTVAALCTTVIGGEPCISELRMDEVRQLFGQRYEEDMSK